MRPISPVAATRAVPRVDKLMLASLIAKTLVRSAVVSLALFTGVSVPRLRAQELKPQVPDAPTPQIQIVSAQNVSDAPLFFGRGDARDSSAAPAAPVAAATPATEVADPISTLTNLFHHNDARRWMLSGQANIIFQADPGFHALYTGANSFINRGEYKTSMVGTIYSGFQIRKDPRSATDFLLDIEAAGGRGLGEALGVAGFTNLDVVRNPNLGSLPYIARIQLHQTIGFTDNKTIEATRTNLSLSTLVPERRLELRFGKLSTVDLFDNNGIGTDSHLQFMNWTIDNAGSYDYAADTRGYTYGAFSEYDDKIWSARYMLALMPTVANGLNLDWNVRRASGQNMEFELRKAPLSLLLKGNRPGVVRVLSFVNHAHMGLYSDAVKAYLAGTDATPTITLHEQFGAVKYGFGLNVEQLITGNLRTYARFGWNEGLHESYAYTEVDQTVSAGGDYSGSSWHRPLDKIGIAGVSNAISRDHSEYLKLGGLGFVLGDGKLNYGRENILEGYYNMHAWRGAYYAFDTQVVDHPGYNRDRGPFVVFSVRTHIDF